MSAMRRIFALTLVAVAVAITGCGGDSNGKPIPAGTATGLQAQLEGVQRRIDQGSAGACKDILGGSNGPNKQQAQDLIDSMPDSVDSDVKSALQDSFDHLWDLVQQECDDKASNTQTETTPADTQTEITPTTETTQTETTQTETTQTETTPTSPDAAPLPNDGNGNGNGNGGGVSPGALKQNKKDEKQ
jgi:hypothetical protein